MKKIISLSLAAVVLASALVGCGSSDKKDATDAGTQANNASQAISVISREDGSGTRGAFVELVGVEVKENDEKIDKTIDTAEITNSTGVMMTTVAGNPAAIGYISLGSLDDTVKAVQVDGVEATADNVKNGTYKVARPFTIVTKGTPSDVAQDFINYILSDEGQKIVTDNGYVSEKSSGAFKSNGASGKIAIGGSSSVTPVMEKLQEAYLALNSKASIGIQQIDSTTGVTSTIDGTFDIGMASRELKDEEIAKGVTGQAIALDGIAVIVNNDSAVTSLTTDQIKDIYTGVITDWSEIK